MRGTLTWGNRSGGLLVAICTIIVAWLLLGDQSVASGPPVEWVRTVGTPANGNQRFLPAGVGIDSAGNVFVGCGFYDFSTPTSPSSFSVKKYDSQGNLIWTCSAPGTSPAASIQVGDLAVDSSGNVYCALVSYAGYLRFGNLVLGTPPFGGNNWLPDLIVAKVSSSGQFVWAKLLASGAHGGSWQVQSPRVVVDSQDTAYVCWSFGKVWNGGVGKAFGDGFSLDAKSTLDILVAHFSPGGTVNWLKTYGETYYNYGTALLVGDNDLYFGGDCAEAQFGDTHIRPGGSGSAGFVAKATRSGEAQRAYYRTADSYAPFFEDLVRLDDSRIGAAGIDSGAAYRGFVVLLDNNLGLLRELSFGTDEYPTRLALAPDKRLLVGGMAAAGDSPFGAGPFYLQKFASDFSTTAWKETISARAEPPVSMIVGKKGETFVVGVCGANLTVDDTSFTVGASEVGSVFLLKLEADPGVPIFLKTPTAQSRPPGEGARFVVETDSDTPVSYQWFVNDKPIPGETAAELVIESASTTNEGRYYVEAKNAAGSKKTDPVPFAVIPKPHILVSTIAGSGEAGYLDAENGLEAKLNGPSGGGVAADGTYFFADSGSHCVRFWTDGVVGTYAGQNPAGFKDGAGTAALFNGPMGTQLARNGDLLVADTANDRVRRVTGFGFRTVVTIAGSGSAGASPYLVNGPALSAKFAAPVDAVEDLSGNVYVADSLNHAVRKIARDGTVSTLAGNGTAGFADGIGTDARFNQVSGLAISGNALYVADRGNHRVRKVMLDGRVTTVAGMDTAGWKDGFPNEALLDAPNSVAVDKQGNVFVADAGNDTIREIRASDGLMFTAAGLGRAGFAEGDETQALFNGPGGIAVAADGSLIVADTLNNRIRKVDMNPGAPPPPDSDAAMLTADLNPGLTIYGKKGKTYRIECREDPASGEWIALENVTLSGRVQKWFDPRPATNTRRVYRAVVVE